MLRAFIQPTQFTTKLFTSSYLRNLSKLNGPRIFTEARTAEELIDLSRPLDRCATVARYQTSSTTEGGSQRRQDDALQSARGQLHQWTTLSAAALRGRAKSLSSAAAIGLSRLGEKLNEITGYEEIEALKRRVVDNETRISDVRQAARETKVAYDEAVSRRSISQREVNDLLQRKSQWTDADVVRFTQLVRDDHLFEQAETNAKAAAMAAEDGVERAFNELMRSILARYHEEQVWSDKIRSASTYGSLLVLGLNLLVFVLALVLVEPWKRKKLVETFERRVVEMNDENRAVIEAGMMRLAEHLARQEVSQAAYVASRPVDHDGPPKEIEPTEDGRVSPQSTASNRDQRLLSAAIGGVIGAGVIGWLGGSWYAS